MSSQYEDIISRSSKIECEYSSPSRFCIKTETEEFGTLKRKMFGTKNHNKINKTILLVGETGSGKSTLINVLFNFLIGVEWNDNMWFEIVEEDENENETESQTSDVIVYEIYEFEDKKVPYSLTVIDTPGYGSTAGIQHDILVTQRLYDLFRSEKGVYEINVVGLVLKGTVNRRTERIQYILDSVVSLFDKDMETKIVLLITHSDKKKPKNALKVVEVMKIKTARENDTPVYFQFNNCQHEERDEEDEKEDGDGQRSFKFSENEMKKLTDFIDEAPPQRLQKTTEVLNERIRLAACVQNLEDRIKLIEMKQTQVKQTQAALQRAEENMEKNKEFSIEVDELYTEQEPINDAGMQLLVFYAAALCCTVCKENCHYPGCTMAWYPEHCEVIKDGMCTVCTKKCPVKDHVKEKWRYVNKTRKVTQTIEYLKTKYENSEREGAEASSLLIGLEKEMEKLQSLKNQFVEEAFNHIIQLEQIALNVNSLSTCVYYDFLIEKMEEKGDQEEAQKMKEMNDKVDKVTRAGMQFFKLSLSSGEKH